jgi:hypothetical protein
VLTTTSIIAVVCTLIHVSWSRLNSLYIIFCALTGMCYSILLSVALRVYADVRIFCTGCVLYVPWTHLADGLFMFKADHHRIILKEFMKTPFI